MLCYQRHETLVARQCRAYPASHTSTFSTAEQRTRRTSEPFFHWKKRRQQKPIVESYGKIIIKRIKAVTTLFVEINKFLLMKSFFLFFFLLICCSITDAQTDSIIYYRKALQSRKRMTMKSRYNEQARLLNIFSQKLILLYYGQEALKLSQLERL